MLGKSIQVNAVINRRTVAFGRKLLRQVIDCQSDQNSQSFRVPWQTGRSAALVIISKYSKASMVAWDNTAGKPCMGDTLDSYCAVWWWAEQAIPQAIQEHRVRQELDKVRTYLKELLSNVVDEVS